MNIELEVLRELKSIRDSFPEELKSRIEKCKTMRHKEEE